MNGNISNDLDTPFTNSKGNCRACRISPSYSNDDAYHCLRKADYRLLCSNINTCTFKLCFLLRNKFETGPSVMLVILIVSRNFEHLRRVSSECSFETFSKSHIRLRRLAVGICS